MNGKFRIFIFWKNMFYCIRLRQCTIWTFVVINSFCSTSKCAMMLSYFFNYITIAFI